MRVPESSPRRVSPKRLLAAGTITAAALAGGLIGGGSASAHMTCSFSDSPHYHGEPEFFIARVEGTGFNTFYVWEVIWVDQGDPEYYGRLQCPYG